jgi:hypothetical protein
MNTRFVTAATRVERLPPARDASRRATEEDATTRLEG